MKKFNHIPCNPKNYGKERNLKDIKAIVIHYTGNKGDSAESNANYFKNKIVNASAHYFISKNGSIVLSVSPKNNAYSVGVRYTDNPKYWQVFNNKNTISIELCDIKDTQPSKEQIKSIKHLINELKKECVNCKKVVRHYDICGKICPASLIDNKKWVKFLKKVGCDTNGNIK